MTIPIETEGPAVEREERGQADADPWRQEAVGGPAGLLRMLQYADSLFPSGASAFSWGLESLQVDGMACSAPEVLDQMRALIEQRWAGFDRRLMCAAHHAASGAAAVGVKADAVHIARGAVGIDACIDLDQLCEAMTLCDGARLASRRLGFTQLRVHSELGLPVASAYLEAVRAGRAPGHLPVVQGLVWHALGLTLRESEAMSAFGVCLCVAGAAMRLGLIGHIESQRLLTQMRAPIEAAIEAADERSPPDVDDLWTGSPALEIAAMRHEPRAARLFAN